MGSKRYGNNCCRSFSCIIPTIIIFYQLSIFRTFLGIECSLSELYQIMLKSIFQTNLKCEFFIWIIYSFKDREAPFILIHSERWQRKLFLINHKWKISPTYTTEIYYQKKALNFMLDSHFSHFIWWDYNKDGFWNSFRSEYNWKYAKGLI